MKPVLTGYDGFRTYMSSIAGIEINILRRTKDAK